MLHLRQKLAIQFLSSNFATVTNFIVSIVLARLLSPSEIGIFSITAVVVNFSHVFRDFGVAAFIKRQKHLTPDMLRAALGVLMTSSWIIAATLFVASDFLAAYFRQPGVGDTMKVLAIGFFFIPFGAVSNAVLGRELQAGKAAIATGVSTVVYATSCITLAYLGFSYMSLAWGNLLNIIASVTTYNLLRPKGLPWLPSLRGWRSVAHFGLGAMLSSALKAIDNAIPDLFLGKLSTAHNVGLFSRANSTVNILNHVTGPTLNYVSLPYMAAVHHSGADLGAEVTRAIAYLTAIAWPILAVTAALAPEVIETLYGSAWLECAPVIPLLCLACAVQITFSFLQPALTGIGRPYWTALPLVLVVAAKIALGLALFDGSLVSFAYAVVIAEVASIPAYLYLAHKHIQTRPGQLMLPLVSSLTLTLAVSLAVAGIKALLFDSVAAPFERLVVAGAIVLPVWTVTLLLIRHPLRRELLLMLSTVSATLQVRKRSDSGSR
ncbi:MAG TPA: oligosaccharide flippase family protein [Burkholderiales bacterium]|nr:oligosaccharide flippase family protein [Burkholderiales bacterium]